MSRHNNWLTTNLSDRKKNKNLDFEIFFNSYNSSTMAFEEAADYTAKLLNSKYQNLWLAFSGGLDSEFVANVLYRNNINFTPITFYDKNSPSEAHMAMHWCEKHDKKLVLIDDSYLNINFQNKIRSIRKYFNIENSIGACNIMLAQFVSKQKGHLVTGFGDPFDLNNEYPKKLTEVIELPEWDFYTDLIDDHPGAFFCYTKEIFKAIINEMDYSKTMQDAKSQLYKIPFRPKIRNHLIQSIENLKEVYTAKNFHRFGFKNEVLSTLN